MVITGVIIILGISLYCYIYALSSVCILCQRAVFYNPHALSITHGCISFLGVYHQYDAFIYPKLSWGAAIKQSVGYGDDSNTLEMRKQALIIYLDCKNSLSMTGTSGPGRLIMSLVDDIEHIFNSLLKCVIFHESVAYYVVKEKDFEASLKQVKLKNLSIDRTSMTYK